jgi:hypothetical protein
MPQRRRGEPGECVVQVGNRESDGEADPAKATENGASRAGYKKVTRRKPNAPGRCRSSCDAQASPIARCTDRKPLERRNGG